MKLNDYKIQIVNLGLLQFFLYKLLGPRRRLWSKQPVSLYSRHAKFPLKGLLPKYMRNNVAITVTYLVESVPI